MKKSNVSEWHKRFKAHGNVEDGEGSGCPRSYRTDVNVEKVRNLVCSDRRLSINRAYYVEMLTRVREAVRRKGPEVWPNYWLLHSSLQDVLC
jgi:hypothetical protein